MIDSITAEDNLTLITVNAINCDESVIPVVLNAVAETGIEVYPVSAAPSYRDYISVSFCVSDVDFTATVTALGGIKDKIPDFHCCITGDVTRISLCSDIYDFTDILKALTDEGIRIRFSSVHKDCICLYTCGVYTGMALNVINILNNKSNS